MNNGSYMDDESSTVDPDAQKADEGPSITVDLGDLAELLGLDAEQVADAVAGADERARDHSWTGRPTGIAPVPNAPGVPGVPGVPPNPPGSAGHSRTGPAT